MLIFVTDLRLPFVGLHEPSILKQEYINLQEESVTSFGQMKAEVCSCASFNGY